MDINSTKFTCIVRCFGYKLVSHFGIGFVLRRFSLLAQRLNVTLKVTLIIVISRVIEQICYISIDKEKRKNNYLFCIRESIDM